MQGTVVRDGRPHSCLMKPSSCGMALSYGGQISKKIIQKFMEKVGLESWVAVCGRVASRTDDSLACCAVQLAVRQTV